MKLTIVASVLQAVFCVLIAVGLGMTVGTASSNRTLGVGVGLFMVGVLGTVYAIAMERR